MLQNHKIMEQGPSRAMLAAMLASTVALAVYLAVAPFEFLAIAAAIPLALIVCVRAPFLFVLVFVAFAYFRLHEAYPALSPYKIPVLAAGAALLGFVLRAASTTAPHLKELRFIALLFTAAAFAAAGAFSGLEMSMNDANQALLAGLALLCGCLAMLAWAGYLGRGILGGWPQEFQLFVWFFVLVSLGVIFAKDRVIAYDLWASTFAKIGMMTVAIAWLTQKPRDFALASKALVISGCLVALVVVYNKINGIGIVEGSRVTIPGAEKYRPVLGDPNDLALVLLFPFGMACAMAIHERGRFRGLIGLAAAPLLLAGIVFTQSRGGLMGVVAVFGVIGWLFVRPRILLAPLAFAALIGLAIVADIGGRVSGGYAEYSGGGLDASAEGRLTAWAAAVRMMLDAPLTGVGLGNFTSQYYFYTDVWTGLNKAVHSTWFEVLAETGLPAFALFVLMYAACLRSAWRSVKTVSAAQDPRLQAAALGLFTGLIGFGVSGSFLTQGFSWPLYIQLGLVSALACMARTAPGLSTPEAAHGL